MTVPEPPQFHLWEILSPEGRPLFYNPYSGKYTSSKSYGQRMQRGYQRGLPQNISRGKKPRSAEPGGPELSESQWRRMRFGQRTGLPLPFWFRMKRLFVDEINARAWPAGGTLTSPVRNDKGRRVDPRVYPSDLGDVKKLWDGGYRDPVYPDVAGWEAWIMMRLNERLVALIQYQDAGDRATGRAAYDTRSEVWLGVMGVATGPPIELWYYH